MNNIIYLKNDPILVELNDSVDKKSAKKMIAFKYFNNDLGLFCLLYTSPSPRDKRQSRMPAWA